MEIFHVAFLAMGEGQHPGHIVRFFDIDKERYLHDPHEAGQQRSILI